MSAQLLKGTTPGGKRSKLGEVLPLDTPFLVQIFPVYACNFKCSYCLHALPRSQHGYISNTVQMSFELYKKCIDDMSGFNKKVRMLRFAGIGEPLLHKDIAAMVRYAKEKNAAESVDIVTNGLLLNEPLSLALIDAGLDRLRISIQGTSEAKYRELSQTSVELSKFLEVLRFFRNHRRDTKIYVKIIDCALADPEEEKRFYETYGEIADFIAIEHLTPNVEGIDYARLAGGKSLDQTQNGTVLLQSEICPQPFYMMQINPDGMVVPCCSMEYPGVFGDASSEAVPEIWNGRKLSAFRKSMLNGVKQAAKACRKCCLFKYGLLEEDLLEPYADKLKELY